MQERLQKTTIFVNTHILIVIKVTSHTIFSVSLQSLQ